MVSAIKSRINFCFSEAISVVTVEDIIEMRNVDNALTEADIYNARIFCHYIA